MMTNKNHAIVIKVACINCRDPEILEDMMYTLFVASFRPLATYIIIMTNSLRVNKMA